MPLAMAVAREALPAERAPAVIGVLSVTTVAGVGLGYPLTGLVAEHSVGARRLLVRRRLRRAHPGARRAGAARTSPPGGARFDVARRRPARARGRRPRARRSRRPSRWGWTSARLLGARGRSRSRCWRSGSGTSGAPPHPLVDLSLLRSRLVLTADVIALFAGVGMYLLMSMVTRFVQTPRRAGYGFGASVVVAGLVLLPLLGRAASPPAGVAPLVARRLRPDAVLPVGCAGLPRRDAAVRPAARRPVAGVRW